MLVEPGQFEEDVSRFFREGGKGANVTMPFKEDAFNYSEILSPQAEKAGAVNTLSINEQGQILGHNTDGIGLVTDIKANHGGSLHGNRVLMQQGCK